MKKATKKQFIAAMRANDVTKVFQLYAQVRNGEHFERYELCHYLQGIAPSHKLYMRAYSIAHCSHETPCEYKGKHGYYAPSPKTHARRFFQWHFARKFDGYTKVATYGRTNLYATSPYYGHSDYNKAILLPIQGNERTCAALVKLFGLESFEKRAE